MYTYSVHYTLYGRHQGGNSGLLLTEEFLTIDVTALKLKEKSVTKLSLKTIEEKDIQNLSFHLENPLTIKLSFRFLL